EHRRKLVLLLLVGIAVIFIFAVLPQLPGFGRSLHRLRYGNKLWLGAARLGRLPAAALGGLAMARAGAGTAAARPAAARHYSMKPPDWCAHSLA
ncbi:MAG: hypothetical protein KGL15_00510, partial [Acidobacteriota bacterium]|nr:hypothetical protein [Acidobacteriota bacterium]